MQQEPHRTQAAAVKPKTLSITLWQQQLLVVVQLLNQF
jgi:hypothetical protein